MQELNALVEKAASGPLGPEDVAKLRAAMSTLGFLQAELQQKGTSIDKLRRMLFGAPTEKTAHVLKEKPQRGADAAAQPPAPGHGRTPASAYTGAQKRRVAHATL